MAQEPWQTLAKSIVLLWREAELFRRFDEHSQDPSSFGGQLLCGLGSMGSKRVSEVNVEDRGERD